MPRLKPVLTINFNFHEKGRKHKIELCRSAFDGRFVVRFDRVNSTKVGAITISEIAVRIRKLLKLIL